MNPAEEYMLRQSEPYRSILLHLQAVIEREIPSVDLKFKYRIPFYYIDGKPYCFLNQSKDYVDLGFWASAHLSAHIGLMESSGRKILRSLRYRKLEDIDQQVLNEVLQDAYSVREKGFWK